MHSIFLAANGAHWAPFFGMILSYGLGLVCSFCIQYVTHYIVSQLDESQPQSMCEEACRLEVQARNLIRSTKHEKCISLALSPMQLFL